MRVSAKLGIYSLAAILSITFVAEAQANSEVALDTWYQIHFANVDSFATGCGPADPAGPLCHSGSMPFTAAGPSPWTFTAPEDGALLKVIVIGATDDQFEVFDSGSSIGKTSAPSGGGTCEGEGLCLAGPNSSDDTFFLAPGDHSITFKANSFTDGTYSYFIVQEVVAVGGELVSLDMSSLFVAGMLGNSYWILPVLGLTAGAILAISFMSRMQRRLW